MENKEKYLKAEVKIINFEEDIITASNEKPQGPTATVPEPFVVEEGQW